MSCLSYCYRYTYCDKCFEEITTDTVELTDELTGNPLTLHKDQFQKTKVRPHYILPATFTGQSAQTDSGCRSWQNLSTLTHQVLGAISLVGPTQYFGFNDQRGPPIDRTSSHKFGSRRLLPQALAIYRSYRKVTLVMGFE